MKLTTLFATTALATTALTAQAAPIWQDFSLSGLYGDNYEVVDKTQATLTVEYAAKVKYADVFFFLDHMRGGNDGKSNYFELSPRLSLGEVSGQKLAFGPVKDVLIATTWEGSDSADNFLYGFGFDLNIPYFQYANVNLYRVNNENIDDDYQFTFVYGIPVKLGSEDFLIDGFLDWSTAEEDHASEMNWTTQWKWNAGKHFSPSTRLYLGIEHSIWNNKFGIPNADENNVSALVKYHF
ncbi:ion channel protein Tsx (plasmid) [Acinetobacter sp. NCu2D-2]|uniref:outer membrane protein OmpK n=1 Tax=Acinetobacter sp. NCu2D-2 TaxID=1608473 RepID=UPI0007CDDC16|nr:outer membrane protein OmpK [Acinetobacter sp. NCu2D-2]ANF83453.1 ion channel protein Tsx [Acinetobacter sp. NCu2D-2]